MYTWDCFVAVFFTILFTHAHTIWLYNFRFYGFIGIRQCDKHRTPKTNLFLSFLALYVHIFMYVRIYIVFELYTLQHKRIQINLKLIEVYHFEIGCLALCSRDLVGAKCYGRLMLLTVYSIFSTTVHTHMANENEHERDIKSEGGWGREREWQR